MFRHVVSRSQRRLEKRQTVVLLVLVFAVSLVSFSLGVMVGKSGSREVPAAKPAEAPRLPVAKGGPAAAAPETAAKSAKELTFYDSLPRGEQPPLGSGINLPPEGAQPKPAPAPPAETAQATPAPSPGASVQPPQPAAASPAAAEAKPVATAAPASVPEPVAVKPTAPTPAKGTYVLQVASFPKAEDAKAVEERLAGKGYRAYTVQADLGSKGVWYRVFVGPYPSAEAAEAGAAKLKNEEKLSALARRQ